MRINGLKVIDAKKSRIVHVSNTDVRKATTKDPGACAAALACMRELGATEARVHIGRTYLKFNGHWERYQTAKPLRDELVAFDRGGSFTPGEYKLSPMPKSEKLGVKKPTGPKKKNGVKRGHRRIVVGVRRHGANR